MYHSSCRKINIFENHMQDAECQFIAIWENFTEWNLYCRRFQYLMSNFFSACTTFFCLYNLIKKEVSCYFPISSVYNFIFCIIRIFLVQTLNEFLINAKAYLATNGTINCLPLSRADFIWHPIKYDYLIKYLCK